MVGLKEWLVVAIVDRTSCWENSGLYIEDPHC